MSDLNLISLFSGAGGFDHGFEAAGINVRATLEMDRTCCQTLRENGDWAVLEGDIHDIPSEDMMESSGIKKGEVDIVIGGPPCQPFSKSAYWVKGDTKRLEDPRARTLHEYMRVVEDLEPTVFVFENVHGINYTGKEEGFKLLRDLVAGINRRKGLQYSFEWKVLNTADYGVPQTRTRLFLIGHREGIKFRFPEPTHRPGATDGQMKLGLEGLMTFTTAWDAIGDLNDVVPDEELRVNGKWGDLLPSIPEGENYLWHTNRKGGLPLFGWRTRYWSFLLKLAKDRPSWTIQAQPGAAIGPFHWKNRRLSTREMARLQTFPDDVEFTGNRQDRVRQIGNAVPSLLAEILGREIKAQFFGEVVTGEPKLTVEYRRPIPPPEPVQDVPEKYLPLVGEHPDHPGEGKGKWASRQEGS